MIRPFNRLIAQCGAQFYRISLFSTIPDSTLRYTHLPSSMQVNIPREIAPIVSLTTANSKQELRVKQKEVIKKFQMHEHDVGSSQVQIAVLTEKIRSLAKHFSVHKKDKSGMRGLTAMINKRKALMKHLKTHDFESYKRVIVEMDLIKEATEMSKYRS